MIKLRLKEYSINEEYSIIEYKNDARKNELISKYEYWISSETYKRFIFGCNVKLDQENIMTLYYEGYFDSFMEVK